MHISVLGVLCFMTLPSTMKAYCALVILLAAICGTLGRSIHQHNANKLGDDPEVYMTVPEIIQYWGYPVEVHHVTTPDGYILELHRIPAGKDEKSVKAVKQPIYIQHGLFSSSADFVLNPGHESLGFLLADSGYDIWMGNFRGNRYSRKHVNYTTDDHEFWQFSWDQMAKYDIPTTLDYILEQTSQSKLHYIGHSMGTTTMFALLSTQTEYNSKLHAFHALAPVAEVNHVQSPLALLAPLVNQEELLLELLGVDELLPNDALMKFLGTTLCVVDPILCESFVFLACGIDTEELNSTRMPVYIAHTPAGQSVHTVVHYAQEMNSGKFQHYDYGDGNMAIYGQTTPPEYDVSKITAHVVLYWSQNDWLAGKEDVTRGLIQKLKCPFSTIPISYKQFNHLDFVWAVNAQTQVYSKVLEFLPLF